MRAGQGLRRGQGDRESQRRHEEGPGEWKNAGCGVALWWALRNEGTGRTARRTEELCKGPRSSGTRAGSAGELADGGEGFGAKLYQGAGKIR